MADNKKYYYLKLKDSFFDSDEIVLLESMPDGYLYTNILLKLFLRSLKGDGRLMFNGFIPYNSTMLANLTRHSVGVIEKAIKIFEQLGFVEVLDNGAIYMLQIQNFIGESSTEADRRRLQRKQIDDEKIAIGQMSGQMSDKTPPEIEIEIEIDTKKDKHTATQIDKIWSAYPLKKGKADSMKKIPKILKQHSVDEILRAIKRYDDSVKEKQYLCHGSTFFNGKYIDYIDENYDEAEMTRELIPEGYRKTIYGTLEKR